jgi:glutaryl-CoA dehydrogenase
MSRFTGVDFYDLDSQLSDEERMVRDTVRRWVDDRVLPIIERHFEEGSFPAHLVPELAGMGLLGLQLEGYGCAGLSHVIYGLVCQELERGDSGIRSFVSVQGSLAMFPIRHFGDEAQKQRYLPEMAAGRLVGCFGLTEPDHGSDPGRMATRAVKDGSQYVLNGAKMWITNGSIADVAVVWAKLHGEIRGFIVEKGDPGFTAPEMKGKHSLRASVTSELVFDDCRIPADRVLPGVVGLKGPLSCLSSARFGISWGAIGSAMASYCAARDYAVSRLQFGRPIAGFQLVQEKLAWMLREITKAQLLSLQLGRLRDAGRASAEQISLAKMNNVDIARDAARLAREIHGANGISSEYPVMRHLMNLESVYTYEGTHDIHKLVLGRWITGIQAFE